MNKFVLLVIILAAALTVGLYTLPKVVVRDENKQLSASAPGGHTTQTPAGEDAPHSSALASAESDGRAIHEQPLSAEQQKRVETLRMEFSSASLAQKESVGATLIALFHKATRYDSAAYYAGLLATEQPTEGNLLRAGDEYFEAYSFAVDDKNPLYWVSKLVSFISRALSKIQTCCQPKLIWL